MGDDYDIADADVKRLHRMLVIARFCFVRTLETQGGLIVLAVALIVRYFLGYGHLSDWALFAIIAINFVNGERLINRLHGIFGAKLLTAEQDKVLLILMQSKHHFINRGW